MKLSLYALALLLPFSALASQLQTTMTCIQEGQTQALVQSIKSFESSNLVVAEYSFWPLTHGDKKSLLISRLDEKKTFAHLFLETNESRLFVALPLKAGGYLKCDVEMTQVPGEPVYIFEY